MIHNINFVLCVDKCIRRIAMLHLRVVFVGVIHNLRLDKYVLLCRML